MIPCVTLGKAVVNIKLADFLAGCVWVFSWMEGIPKKPCPSFDLGLAMVDQQSAAVKMDEVDAEIAVARMKI